MRSTYYPGVCTKPGTYYQGWFMYMRYTQGHNEEHVLSRSVYCPRYLLTKLHCTVCTYSTYVCHTVHVHNICRCLYVCTCSNAYNIMTYTVHTYTVESPNEGHFEGAFFVLCIETVLFWRFELYCGDNIFGPQAVSFVERLSLFRSVPYRTFHCFIKTYCTQYIRTYSTLYPILSSVLL